MEPTRPQHDHVSSGTVVARATWLDEMKQSDTFAGLPAVRLDALAQPRLVVIGAAEAAPYRPGERSHSAGAARAIREASSSFGAILGQVDFDLGFPVYGPGGDTRTMVDAGDVPTDASDPAGNARAIEGAIRLILDAGAVPLLLGGDDSVPIPAFRAFAGRGPLTVLQIDAHVDWGDLIQGNPDGYGSTMRRAAECESVTKMIQVGIRGLGSGTADQIADARAWGSTILTMRDVRRIGMAGVLEHVPAGQDVIVTIDADGLDPILMPAVNMPTPGGLLYDDVVALLHGVSEKARIAGFFLVEFVPERDGPDKLAALTAARLAAVAMGLVAGPPDPA